MRILKNRHVSRLARRHGIPNADLRSVIERAESGLVDAQIGKFLIKQRLARGGGGKSGGFRAIAFYRYGDLAVLLYLFAKKDRDNLSAVELETYRDAARTIAALSAEDIDLIVARGTWIVI
jgi:hypothetical protein